MTQVALVTDSTANIPQHLIEKYKIEVAPQVLIWNGETYRDGVDIQPNEYYQRLKTAKEIPTTSQASPGSFRDIYKKLLDQNYEILCVLISKELSGTIASAEQAKDEFPGAPIEIFDSRTTAMATGFQVLTAARTAEEGGSLQECLEAAKKAKERTGVIFAVETLEFLHRGGRIGGGSRLLGTALNIKPILEVTGGRVEPVEKVRTRKKSIARLIEIVESRANGAESLRLSVLHANSPEDAQQIYDRAQEHFQPKEMLMTEVSPVIGTHTGPGTVGMAYMLGI